MQEEMKQIALLGKALMFIIVGSFFFYTSPSVNSEMDSVKFLLCLLA